MSHLKCDLQREINEVIIGRNRAPQRQQSGDPARSNRLENFCAHPFNGSEQENLFVLHVRHRSRLLLMIFLYCSSSARIFFLSAGHLFGCLPVHSRRSNEAGKSELGSDASRRGHLNWFTFNHHQCITWQAFNLTDIMRFGSRQCEFRAASEHRHGNKSKKSGLNLNMIKRLRLNLWASVFLKSQALTRGRGCVLRALVFQLSR